MEGILPIYKPAGMTSHDVVAKVRRLLQIRRIGHTGTLDPMVTGVLPLAIGRATRIIEYIQELPKSYEAVVRFGIATDTEDLTGKVIEQTEKVQLSVTQLKATLSNFLGEIEQVPPMYSSLKKDGKRLYELARQGKIVEREPRKVTIYKLDLLEFKSNSDVVEARFTVTCSKGTYVRTLCKDIGLQVGVPAAMADLIRTSSGPFALEDCVTLEEAEHLHQTEQLEERIIKTDAALNHFPFITLDPEDEKKALYGQKIFVQNEALPVNAASIIRVYNPSKRFIGLYSYDQDQHQLIPLKLFL